MKLANLIGQRIKEVPREARTPSHIFLLRGGYVRPVTAGIFTLLPLARRVAARIEGIIRQEMNRLGGQEVTMPVVLPEELWRQSGRSADVGPELLRFRDRGDKPMVLAMTHEEAVCHLARTEISSYRQLPCMLYQIQRKYRDEARPRAGLIRVREFTMKDAYSFHSEQEDLDNYYGRAHDAYERIFQRVGLNNVVSIQSATGIMGGAVSHEFMALADCGEDTLFMSPDGSYRANREVAVSGLAFSPAAEPMPLEKVATPGQKTIDQVAAFLEVGVAQTGKAVFYLDSESNLVFAMVRGDFEVNESKLSRHLQTSRLELADDQAIRACGAEPGYASPMALDSEQVRIVVDPSIAGSGNLVVGANQPDYHYRNFNYHRDLHTGEVADIATVRAGDPCPLTGRPLLEKRGIEVGNIFQLGQKYSRPMECKYLDANGKEQFLLMGCYGIGIGRTLAAVIEQSHDDRGPIWPMAIAPFQVHICALNNRKPEVREAADRLYNELLEAGVEVLYDDRNEKAGFMFNDADLIGAPLRLIVSPKTLAEGKVEFKTRDGAEQMMLVFEEAVTYMTERVGSALGTKAAC